MISSYTPPSTLVPPGGPYQNMESLGGTPLSHYQANQLFETKDHYCFVIEELIQILINQNRFYNPYTGLDLDKEDIQKLMQLPEVIHQQNIMQLNQRYCVSRISNETLKALMQLAIGILNVYDAYASSSDSVRHAQAAYERFNAYYLSLKEDERVALNDFWIDEWSYFFYWGLTVSGMKSQTFGELYSSMNDSCIHSVAGSLFKMVFQIHPKAEFDLDRHPLYCQAFVAYIKSTVCSDNMTPMSEDTQQHAFIDQNTLWIFLAWLAIGAIVSALLFFTNTVTVPLIFVGIGITTTMTGYNLQSFIFTPICEPQTVTPENHDLPTDVITHQTTHTNDTRYQNKAFLPAEKIKTAGSPRFFLSKNTDEQITDPVLSQTPSLRR